MNNSSEPIHLKKNEHFCQIRATFEITNLSDIPSEIAPKQTVDVPSSSTLFSCDVSVDPNSQLSNEWKDKFRTLHKKFDKVLNRNLVVTMMPVGKIRAHVNIGSAAPPTRKLHVPNYSRSNLQMLQEKFDELEREGVFARPEDVGVAVEHVSPSFLVWKQSGGYRLVTAFTSLSEYCKTLPTVMPSVDDTLRTIASWKYTAITDLRD